MLKEKTGSVKAKETQFYARHTSWDPLAVCR